MAAPVILVEAAPRRAADGGSVTVRLAGRGANVPYRYGGQHWRAGIVDLPTIVTSLDFDGGNPGGGGVPQALELRWAPAGNARLADLARYYWADAPITVRVGPEGDAMPPVLLSGTVLDSTVEGGVLRIAMADPAAALKKPLLTTRALGTGGIEGPADFEGLLLARTWGRCFNVVGRPWDQANNIWCFGDPRRRWQSFDAVRDMGAAAAALTPLAWQGSAEATFAALQAAQAPNGGGVIAPDIACVKWWTVPGGDLCADIRGEIEGGYVETAPEIVARIVASRSALTFAAGTIAAAKAARPAVFGWRVEDESTTAADALSQVLGEVSTSWLLTAGEIELRPWSWGAPVATARSHAVSRREVQKPVSTRRLGYRRNWHPMARGDLAAIVLATEVSFGDGTTLEQLKPATPGATAGAPSGTTVGGTINPDTGEVEGGVPADDIAELPPRVQTIEDDVATVKGNIAELFDVFGDSESASASAAIAEQAKLDAQAARDASDAARDEAVEKALAAGASANSASANANVATTKAQEADERADAAAASAEAAHTDATASGLSASSAAQSQVTAAVKAAARGLTDNANFDVGVAGWRDGVANLTTPPTLRLDATYQGRANVLVNDGGTRRDFSGPIASFDATRKYRVRGGIYSSGGAGILWVGVNGRDANSIPIPPNSGLRYVLVNGTTLAAGWNDLVSAVFTGADLPGGTVKVSPIALTNYNGTAGQVHAFDYLYIEDVTESEAARAAADASLSSAASAAASSTIAGDKASVATEQAGLATTKAAQAGASQQAAAISETNAAGSSAAAAASQQLTANAYRSTVLVGGNQQFDNGTDGWTNDPGTNAAMPAGQWVFNASYGGRTNVISTATAAGRNIWSIKTFPITAGRKYKLRGSFHVGNGAPARMYMGVQCYDANGNPVGSNVGYMYILVGGSIYPSGSGWVDVESAVYPSSSFNAGTAYVRLICWANYDNGAVFTALDYLTFEDVTGAADAETQAAISTNQAVIATNAAAAAQTSVTVAASVNSNAINPNGTFSDYPSAAVGAAPGNWNAGTGYGGMQRVAGENGIGYALRLPGNAGGDSYIYGTTAPGAVSFGDWFVIEADFKLISGTLTGAAALFQPVNASGGSLQNLFINIGAKYGAGVVGQTYRARQLVQITAANSARAFVYVMSHWAGAGSNATANVIDWYRCLVRPATDQEIASKQATSDIAALNATVTQNVGAIAAINGAAAFLETIVAAGDGNPAIMRMLAGKDGSGIWLMADRLVVGNPVNGQWVEVARFEDGVAKLNNALIRNLSVLPNAAATIGFPVALEPKIYLANDGQVVSYGGSIGAPAARIEPDLSGIAVPAGSSLDVRALSSTANGFTARAKIIGSPTYSNQAATGGTNVGGTPGWQMDKPTAADAYNGLYQVSATGTLTRIDYYREGPSQWVGTYTGVMSFYVNNGSGFVFVGGVEGGGTFYYQTVPPATIPNTWNETFQYNGAVGQHGGKEFGVAGPITAFNSVTYTTLNAASETAITQNIPFKVYPSR